MFDSPALDLIFTIPFSFSYLFLPDACPCGTWNTKTLYSLVLAVSLMCFFFHKETPLKHQAASGKGRIKRHFESYCRNLSPEVKQVETGPLEPAFIEACWTAAHWWTVWHLAPCKHIQGSARVLDRHSGFDLWSHFSRSLFFFSSFFFFLLCSLCGYPAVWFFRPIGLWGIYLG